MTERTHVVFVGGRSGVGKSAVSVEMFAQLSRADVKHCLIEGDNLDLAHPTPWEHGQPLAEMNLAAMWRNYTSFGFRRLIYTNTASVLEPVMSRLRASLEDASDVTAVLLSASDVVTNERLARRELGSALAAHMERSARAARQLEAAAPAWVHRVDTESRTVADVASEVIRHAGWLDSVPAGG